MAAKRANALPAQYELSTETGNLLGQRLCPSLLCQETGFHISHFSCVCVKNAKNSSLAREGFTLAHSSGHHVSRSRRCWSHGIHSKAERWTLALGYPSALALDSSPLKGTTLQLDDIPIPATGSGNPLTDKPKGLSLQ